jgi:hypothetical protein
MSAHALVGREITCYLEKLHAKEHRDPGQLESSPDGEHDCERILVEYFAEIIGYHGALHVLGSVAILEICLCQLRLNKVWLVEVTGKGQPHPHENAKLHEKHVEHKVSVVVVRHAVVYPRAMAVTSALGALCDVHKHLLITLRNTPLTPLAVLAPERLAHHAVDTEMSLIKLPYLHKLVNHRLGSTSARRFWYVARIGRHGEEVEISREAVKCCE